jgi:hypothetical protein
LTPQGHIEGALTVTDAAIADGSITIDEINANFVFSNVSAPFAPTTFTSAQFQFFSLNFGELYIDRSSGLILTTPYSLSAHDAGTGQSMSFSPTGIGVISGVASTSATTPWTLTGGGPGAVSGIPGGGSSDTITYTFATSDADTPAPGRLNGSFAVPKAAIADGVITFADIISANFSITDPTPPYVAITLTRENFSPSFYGPNSSPEVHVDPVTGVFLHDFYLSSGGVHLFPHRYLVFTAPYVSVRPEGRGQLTVTITGAGSPTGVATPAAVPALHPLALALMLALFGLIGARVLRRRNG